MLYIVKPAARCKPDAIKIHDGPNDITHYINTMKNIRKIVKSIRDCSENTQVLLYGIINRDDGNHNDKISEMNNRMASYSEGQGLIFINNNNNNNKNTTNNNDDDNNNNNNDNDNKAKIEKSQGDSLCRVCRKVDESIVVVSLHRRSTMERMTTWGK